MSENAPSLSCRTSLSEPTISNLTHNDYGSTSAGRITIRTGRSPVELTRPDDPSNHQLHSTGTSTSTLDQIMAQNDMYQGQPLLPEKVSSPRGMFDFSDDDENDILPTHHSHLLGAGFIKVPGVVKINIPGPQREEPRFPKEKWKTFVAFLALVVNFILTTASLALVHERVPDRQSYAPLPDAFLDNVPAVDWALDVSEILIMISTNSCALVLFFHKHRFIVIRRVFIIMSLLYLMRSVTMYVTVLPIASKTYYCSPKANTTTPFVVAKRVLQLISGFGLSINGKHTFCGDYIYSGHTVMLVLSYLVITEYTPKRCFLIHWASFSVSVTGIVLVLVAHGHYTIDVLIAYFVTTRIFWIYHTMANNPVIKETGPYNYLSREWWFPLFKFFEKNVGGPVPRQYDWPLPWPRRFLSKHPNRDS